MDEIFEIADDVAVLRNGRLAGFGAVNEVTPQGLVGLISGPYAAASESDSDTADDPDPTDAGLALRVRGLKSNNLAGIDLDLKRGEILGIAGLLGSGREELPYVLTGAARSSSSDAWMINGTRIDPESRKLLDGSLGITLVPGERDREGLIAGFSVAENLTLGALPDLRRRGWFLSKRHEEREAKRWLRAVGVDPTTADSPITSLSGGNRQRILLARCLHTDPKILVLAEPTAGVDVGARRALYALLEEKALKGLSIVVCSSDVEDLTSLCHRVLVLERGRIRCEFTRSTISSNNIVAAMEGLTA
jgi:ABC-type sugar transport system ATPase subunit